MDRLIVNVACGGWYVDGQRRLQRSLLVVGEPAAFMGWPDSFPPDSLPWPEYRTGFKAAALREASRHAPVIVWADASLYAVRPLTPLWAKIERDGYYVQNNGWNLGQWSSDETLRVFGINRDASFSIST